MHLGNLCASGATLLYKLPQDDGDWGIPALPTDDRSALPSETGALICHGTRPDVQLDTRGVKMVHLAFCWYRGIKSSTRWPLLVQSCPSLYTWRNVCWDGPLEWKAQLAKCTLGKGRRASYMNTCKRGRDSDKSSASEAVRSLIVFLSLPMNVGES